MNAQRNAMRFGALLIAAAILSLFAPRSVSAQTTASLHLSRIDVAGTVRDESGATLPGVKVTALLRKPTIPRQNVVVQSVATATDGTYRLDGIEPAAGDTVLIQATGKGWAPASARPMRWPFPSGSPATVDLTMKPGHWATGRVVDENQSPLEGVRVVLGDSESVTSADGSFLFEDLSIYDKNFQVWAPGSPAALSRPAKLDGNTQIVLNQPVSLGGRASDALSGQPLTSFTVSIRALSNGSPAYRSEKGFDSADGAFALENVDRNRDLYITAKSPGHATSLPVHFKPGESLPPALAFELRPLKPLPVLIVDRASGAPVSGASVYAGKIQANDLMMLSMLPNRPPISVSDASGLALASDGDPPSGLLVRAPGYSELTILASERSKYAVSSGRLVVPLSPAGSISGVAWVEGKVAAGRKIHLSSNSASLRGNTSVPLSTGIALDAVTDSQGHYRFDGLSPAVFMMSISFARSDEPSGFVSRRVELNEGQNLKLNLGDPEGLSALYGVIRLNGRPAPGLQITAHPAFESDILSAGCTADANGEYSLLGLAPGAYRLGVALAANGKPVARTGSAVPAIIGAEPTRQDIDLAP